MDEEETAWWRDVVRGEREVSWDLMARPIDRSHCLIEPGRRVAYWALEQVGRFFGDTWLRRSLRDGSPMMSWLWWPANDTPHTYLRLIELGTRLALLQKTQGWRELRRSARAQTAYWGHGLLQLEVGGFARRHGWTVEFEPALVSGRSADLRLWREEAAFFVEAVSMRPADEVRGVSGFSEQVFERLLRLGQRHGVTVAGEFRTVVCGARLEAWFAHAEETAAGIAGTGRRTTLPTPGGGELLLADGDPPEGEAVRLSGPEIIGDEWSRVDRVIADKAEQARSGLPLWLRIDETRFLWNLTIPAAWPRRQMHEALADNIAAGSSPCIMSRAWCCRVHRTSLWVPPRPRGSCSTVEPGARSGECVRASSGRQYWWRDHTQPELINSRSGGSGTWRRGPGWTGPWNSSVSRPSLTSLRRLRNPTWGAHADPHSAVFARARCYSVLPAVLPNGNAQDRVSGHMPDRSFRTHR